MTPQYLVCLGDLYADTCCMCNDRAEYGRASKSGPEGCVEAIKNGTVYCDRHRPVDLKPEWYYIMFDQKYVDM